MKTKFSLVLKSTFVALLMTVAALSSADRAGAFTLIEREIFFPDLGIIKGQTARINVTNLSGATMYFSSAVLDDKNVNHLPPTDLILEPGQTGHADLNADYINNLEGRQQFRALVKFVDNPDLRKAGRVMSSLEIFDNDTGKTQLVVLPAVQ